MRKHALKRPSQHLLSLFNSYHRSPDPITKIINQRVDDAKVLGASLIFLTVSEFQRLHIAASLPIDRPLTRYKGVPLRITSE